MRHAVSQYSLLTVLRLLFQGINQLDGLQEPNMPGGDG